MSVVLVYTVLIAVMMVSTIPTYSGKLLGERIRREYVLPIFILAIGLVACLLTFPYETLAIASLAYLAIIPLSWRRFLAKEREGQPLTDTAAQAQPSPAPGASPAEAGRVVDLRPAEPKR
jgi:CDP-diacylglycerol--serine O-phosphatidyltransferase